VSVTTAIDKMAEPIGFDIAQGTDETQAALLNGLARGFRHAMPQGSAREMQICYLTALLSSEARQFLVDLVAMCEAES
jgi:hypothetical protein